MPRKIFISILGTGYYHETKYYFGNKPDGTEKTTRFIQEASLINLCSDWSKNDKAYIFVTKGEGGSKSKNWKDEAQIDHPDGSYIGLNKVILDNKFSFKSECVEIPDGFNNDEIWDIFELVFSKIEEGDELYFDITHSFRSIPMLVMVLINYAKLLKNVKVLGIYYGAFEKLGPGYLVKKMSLEKRVAPVLDLTSFSQLQDWTNAANIFLKYGSTEMLASLIDNNSIKESLNSFSGIHNTVRAKELFSGEIAEKLLGQMNKFESEIQPFEPIRERIVTELKKYKRDDVINNGLSAIQYCIEFDLIQQGITLMTEFVTTYILVKLNKDWKDGINRTTVSGCLSINSFKSFDQSGLKVNLMKKVSSDKLTILEMDSILFTQLELAESVFNLPYRKRLSDKIIKNISQGSRNDINHAGIRDFPKEHYEFKKSLSKYFNRLIVLIKDVG